MKNFLDILVGIVIFLVLVTIFSFNDYTLDFSKPHGNWMFSSGTSGNVVFGKGEQSSDKISISTDESDSTTDEYSNSTSASQFNSASGIQNNDTTENQSGNVIEVQDVTVATATDSESDKQINKKNALFNNERIQNILTCLSCILLTMLIIEIVVVVTMICIWRKQDKKHNREKS